MDEKKSPVTDNQIDDEEDLLNFDLDDIASEDSDLQNLGSDPEDEIIELTDLVEKGPGEEETRDVEVANWLKESQSIEIEKDIDFSASAPAKEGGALGEEGTGKGEEEFDVSDISLELDLDDTGEEPGQEEITAEEIEKLLEERTPEEQGKQVKAEPEVEEKGTAETDLEALLEEAGGDEIELELDQEAGEREVAEEPAVAGSDLADETVEEEPGIELDLKIEQAQEAQPQISVEKEQKLEEAVSEGLSDEGARAEEVEGAREEKVTTEVIGITEERIEELITKVVEDVVERVVRETVAEVAQKVIGQAIEALEKSLESASSD
ncbi:MAG: hypothetical protein JRI79_14410 [Deltaproteobacteria bacterium]|nr:hypothetical protein [Deltaproteobacteria bacterium]MBW1919399.1 hypothetical protein [Deltaproteobacteria bacterium]MBW1979138.1 hypothetical protein [Deltaproteobacteria bacterium]MBW2045965.1 hypothetical protein [Deltaproteobacteria bacterium]MBW2301892.1 hypothetical protein [Deltaproteobacteria bacterium]